MTGHRLRLGGVPLVGLLVVFTGGCQRYERRPTDIAGHHAAFLARSPESREVRSFAARLAAREPDAAEFDTADGISCAEAEVIALVFNADLRLARLRAGVARANAEHASLWEDPTIGIDLARILESTPEPWKVFTSVGITIPISGRLEIEKQRAGIEHAGELARVAQREWSVRMSVRRAWSEWSALDAHVSVTRDFLDRVDQVLSVVDRMEHAGEMARTEARLFRIEKATKALDLAVLESRMREADLRLRRLMGMSPDAPLGLQASVSGPARPEMAGDTTRSTDAAGLAGRSLAMLVAAAEYDAAEKALELEVRKQYPDLHLGPGYGREDGQHQVLLGLTIPIPILNANRRGIAEARAQREAARAGVETTMEHTIAELRGAEVRLAAATRRRRTLESEVVPMVDAQYSDTRQMARLGEVNTLVLLESVMRQHEAKVALILATRDEAIARVDIDELIGPEPLARPTEPGRITPTDPPSIAPTPTAGAGR